LFSREVRNALSMTNGERVFDRNQRVRALMSRSFECAIEVVRGSHFQGLNLYPQCPTRGLRLLEDERRIRIGRIPKHRHTSKPGQNLFQQFEPLPAQVRRHEAHPRDVAAGARQTGNEPAPQWIASGCHDDRNGGTGLLGC
jgi:hypothetical protein